ncbi:MAG: D-tyrosyl-tRNA(Tyr) deacylase [Anaerovibrio sp.]|nr:D-tyrosyl-tRNA(Tyr) deacylase [Anaerovibrio sp.]
MRAVVTRVNSASVEIDGKIHGAIDKGFLVLLGVGPDDTEEDAAIMAEKICNCRIFPDEEDKMNLNLAAVGGSLLVVSQFTLFADVRKRRPSFSGAGKPDIAIPLYEKFMSVCREKGFRVEHGEFGAMMKVNSENDGPVTLLFDTVEWRK